MHACVRTYVRKRELASACERSSGIRRTRSREPAGPDGRTAEDGGQGRGVEALEEEVRGQPHSRRGRRDAHRATPTRKSFSTKPSSSLRLLFLLLLVFPRPPAPSVPLAARPVSFSALSACVHETRRAREGPSALWRTVRYVCADTKFLAYQQEYFGASCLPTSDNRTHAGVARVARRVGESCDRRGSAITDAIYSYSEGGI